PKSAAATWSSACTRCWRTIAPPSATSAATATSSSRKPSRTRRSPRTTSAARLKKSRSSPTTRSRRWKTWARPRKRRFSRSSDRGDLLPHSSISFLFAWGRFAFLIAGFLLRHLQLQSLVEVRIIQCWGSIEDDPPPRWFGLDAGQVGGGDLQAVEREGGALGVEASRQHPVDDLQHSCLDGIAILQNGHELDPRHPAHEVEIA